MKRAILLVVVLVGGAFYLGWFTFTTDSSGPTEHVNIAIDKDKVHQDEARAIEKLHSFEQQIETQSPNASPALPRPDRASRQPAIALPQSVSPYETEQPGGYATQPIEPPAAGTDPYELPEDGRPATRPAAETASESLSRGFQ